MADNLFWTTLSRFCCVHILHTFNFSSRGISNTRRFAHLFHSNERESCAVNRRVLYERKNKSFFAVLPKIARDQSEFSMKQISNTREKWRRTNRTQHTHTELRLKSKMVRLFQVRNVEAFFTSEKLRHFFESKMSEAAYKPKNTPATHKNGRFFKYFLGNENDWALGSREIRVCLAYCALLLLLLLLCLWHLLHSRNTSTDRFEKRLSPPPPFCVRISTRFTWKCSRIHVRCTRARSTESSSDSESEKNIQIMKISLNSAKLYKLH